MCAVYGDGTAIVRLRSRKFDQENRERFGRSTLFVDDQIEMQIKQIISVTRHEPLLRYSTYHI